MIQRLDRQFYLQSGLDVAIALLGKTLVRAYDDGTTRRYKITITEAYCGSDDNASHAHKGRTSRTEVMFHEGGKVYVYLIYGMYWLLNVVAGEQESPHAVLICGIDDIHGSGRVGRELKIDKSFYGDDLTTSKNIWIEDSDLKSKYIAKPRVGIDYAGEWKNKLWRFEVC